LEIYNLQKVQENSRISGQFSFPPQVAQAHYRRIAQTGGAKEQKWERADAVAHERYTGADKGVNG
jgi:hypothetical protein